MQGAGTQGSQILYLSQLRCQAQGAWVSPPAPALQPCKSGLRPLPSSAKTPRLERPQQKRKQIQWQRAALLLGVSRGQPFFKVTDTLVWGLGTGTSNMVSFGR